MRITSIALALALSACSVGPDYHPATGGALGVPDHFAGATPAAKASDLAMWWSRFGDADLTTLIERAVHDNLDIAQARARLAQAREGVAQARAARLPSLETSTSVGRNRNHGLPDTTSYAGSIDARWSADLFGGLSRSAEAARASVDAADFSLAEVRTAVAAEVARNVIDARTLAARLAIARDTLRTQDDNLEIARFRAQAGLVSSLDVEQARSQRSATAAAIPGLIRAEAAARYRLAVLTGQAPGAADAFFVRAAPIPVGAPDTATGIPADLLRQRPDVRAAERRLAAATARIGVAQAQLYPALMLSANLQTQATSLRTLTDIVTGGVFAQIAQTLFDGGRLRSVVRQNRAATDEAFAAYKSSVLAALEDIENALAARDSAETRATALAQQVDAATAAALLARSNYRAGLSDFRTLLDAERTLLSARDGLAAATGDRATAIVQLYLALGGGWSPAGPVT